MDRWQNGADNYLAGLGSGSLFLNGCRAVAAARDILKFQSVRADLHDAEVSHHSFSFGYDEDCISIRQEGAALSTGRGCAIT